MNKEEVNEILIAMTRNGRLLMLEDKKKVQYYRTVDETPGHEHVKGNEGEDMKQELLDTVNLLFEYMGIFQRRDIRGTFQNEIQTDKESECTERE